MEALPLDGPIKGKAVFSLSITWAALCTIVIVLRFWSRLTLRATIHTRRFYWDDWIALAAWVSGLLPLGDFWWERCSYVFKPFVISFLFLTAYTRDYGMGRHFDTVPLFRRRRFMQLFYGMYHTYDFAVALSRISALFFYRRIFEATDRTFLINFWACLTTNIAWLSIMSCVALFNCVPIHAFWDHVVPGYTGYTCIKTINLELGHGVTSVVIDLWILLIPVPFLWKLRMTQQKKFLVIMVFILGYW